MVPTLQVHDRVLVNKLSYKLHPVHRGDIVVFKAPEGSDPGIDDLVKRVIGLPEETVSAHGGHVYINGKQLPETYLPKGTITDELLTGDAETGPLLGDGRQSRQFEGLPRLRADHEGQHRREGVLPNMALLAARLHVALGTSPERSSASHAATVATMRSGRSQ